MFMVFFENLKLKRELKDNLGQTEIMIPFDFVANYMTKYGKEIQSIRFWASENPISIHTGVRYGKTDASLQTFSVATGSDHLEHPPNAFIGSYEICTTEYIEYKRTC